jgi:hypothetical protein
MTLQIIFGALLSTAGILTAGLGLIFLIASHGVASRLAAGFIMSAGGLIALVAGVVLFRRGSRFNPSGIRKELLRLARIGNGELAEEAVAASLGDSDAVRYQIQTLVREGIASEIVRDRRRVWVFAGLQMKMVVKKCPYCGNDYPVRDDIERCPTCGGDLKLDRSALAKGDKGYSMDGGDDSGVG